jgi:hypothetical protein
MVRREVWSATVFVLPARFSEVLACDRFPPGPDGH